MNLKLFRLKKKALEDHHQKKTSYLCSPEEFNSSGRINKGSSKIQEDLATSMRHPLDEKTQETNKLSVMNARNPIITKAIVLNFRKKSQRRGLTKKRRKVLWQHGMIQILLKPCQTQKMKEPT